MLGEELGRRGDDAQPSLLGLPLAQLRPVRPPGFRLLVGRQTN
jgi:hypothetical protein